MPGPREILDTAISPSTYTGYLKNVIDQTKQQWAATQQLRDQESKVASSVIDAAKKGDFGTATEILLNHIGERSGQAAESLVGGAYKNLKANLTEADPNHGEVYAAPITPVPGVSAALEDFAEEEATGAAGTGTAASAQQPSLWQRVKQAVSPKAATQPNAQAALREGAAASAKDAGLAASDTSGSIRTILDKPIEEAGKAEDALYQKINDAAETDMKSLYDRREELQDALEDPTNISQKSAMQKELATTDSNIAKGEANLQTKLGKDAGDLIKQAKSATQQRYAMEEGVKKLFNNEGVISGNLEHGAPEQINVNSAIKSVENLDKPSKFAPRGSPSRLEQMFGKDGAKAIKQGLYDAQKAGQKVATRNTILAWLSGASAATGTAYELLSK